MGNTSAMAITFLCKCKTVPNAKDLQKLGTLELSVMRKKRKISVPCFQSTFEVGGIFSQQYNSCRCVSLKKLVKFPTLFLSNPHPKQHRIFSAYLCAAS